MSSSSSAAACAPDHLLLLSPSDQLCYVHCEFCDTILAVSVPLSSLFKTVTVRCGHCSNLLPVSMRGCGSLLPSPTHHLHLSHSFYSPQNLLNCEQEEIHSNSSAAASNSVMSPKDELLPDPQVAAKRPPETRQRVPSAYNRFIKDEIQRIKAGNPDISHREAFSAAAKNWAHFPHIQFGINP